MVKIPHSILLDKRIGSHIFFVANSFHEPMIQFCGFGLRFRVRDNVRIRASARVSVSKVLRSDYGQVTLRVAVGL